MDIKLVELVDTELFVGLADMKSHLQVDFATDDALITEYIKAATGYCERIVGITLTKKKYSYTGVSNEAGVLSLYRTPIVSIEAIADDNGTTPVGYKIYGSTDRYNACLKGLLPNKEYTLTYIAGYDNTEKPTGAQQAVKLCCSQFYDNRAEDAIGSTAKLGITIDKLLGLL